MSDVISFSDLNWFAENITDARLLTQKLLASSIDISLLVYVNGILFVLQFLSDTSGTENIGHLEYD